MTARRSYAELIRSKINTIDNPTNAPISKRDLAKLTGYSYEHIRKLLKGEPVPSREFNATICRVLGLDGRSRDAPEGR